MFYRAALLGVIGIIVGIFVVRLVTGIIQKKTHGDAQSVPVQLVFPHPEMLDSLPNQDSGMQKRYFSKINVELSDKDNKTKKKDKGPSIKTIQYALKNAGFTPGVIDGKNGPATKKAIKLFQQKYHLPVDGIVGPQTWDILRRFIKSNTLQENGKS